MSVLTSLGVQICIGSSSSRTTKPTTWDKIPQVIEISEIDLEPDTIDTTSFDNEKYKSSVPGLIDTSGIQYILVNADSSESAENLWNTAAEDAASTSPKYIWLCIIIPNKTKATFIPITPIATGAYNVTLNDRITIRLRYTIREDLEFGAAPSIT